MNITSIQIGNKALEFIERRISDDMYRGNVSSEHNRYDMREIHTILQLINKYVPNKSLMRIRTTDISKRPNNIPAEYLYAEFCNEVKSTVEKKKGTQDSIRKNIFLDLHRMGFIDRFDTLKTPILPYTKHKNIKYIALTDFGKRFAEEQNILNQSYMFAKALDKLLEGYLELTLELLYDFDNNIKRLSKYEYMFFVTAVNTDTSFNISKNECIELINEFRKLSPAQCRGVIELLKAQLNPNLFVGNKKNKRDWGNWCNKIEQIFNLFKQTAYFEVLNDILQLKIKKITTAEGSIKEVIKRSTSAKLEYFKNHNVEKKKGFELHHVLPLSWAESPEQFKLFDNWKNLVYIDAFSHSKITQNNNRNIILTNSNYDIILSDFSNNSVFLINNTNIIYNTKLLSQMLDYNFSLSQTVMN